MFSFVAELQYFLTLVFVFLLLLSNFPQSDMASVKVPELDLELASGTLGGIVTTVEGLITKISESKFYFFTSLSILISLSSE